MFLFASIALAFLCGSLPQLDGEVIAPAVSARMAIERDDAGVPTIVARNRLDIAYGIGYLHAQDRFFQMDLLRRSAAGELAEMFGPEALDYDKEHRLFRLRARAAIALTLLPPNELSLLRRYTQGVNDGLSALRARPFEYALLGEQPVSWRAEDSLLVIWAMYFQLQGTFMPREIARDWMRSHVSPEQLDFLLPSSSVYDAPLDGPLSNVKLSAVPGNAPGWWAHGGAGNTHTSLNDRSSVGSNNWALAGNRSADGSAIVGDDMHLMLGLPTTWYRATFTESRADGAISRSSGVTLPGLPALVIGSNGHVAWGFTNAYADDLNLIPIQPDITKPEKFKVNNAWQFANQYVESIRVKGDKTASLAVLETTAGPIRKIGQKFFAVHWVALLPGAVNLELAQMSDAVSVDEGIKVANAAGIPPENIVIGDIGGHIGWTIAGPLPDRRNQASGDRLTWQTLLPQDAYPRIVDPVDGQVWTANNRQLAGENYRLIGDGGALLGARASQLRDDLAALGRTNEITAYRVQLDDRALFMSQWRDRALRVLDNAALAGHPERAEFRRVLMTGWTGHASVDSAGYTLARNFLDRLYDITFDNLNAQLQQLDQAANYEVANPRWPVVITRLLDEQPTGWLPAGMSSWRAVQIAAIDKTIDALTAGGRPLADATWGMQNKLQIAHPFADRLPLLGRLLKAPTQPMAGDSHMPRVAAPDFGQSERMVVSPGHEDAGVFNMPGGQSGHPLSPFFLAGHKAWVNGAATPFLPGATKHTLIFRP